MVDFVTISEEIYNLEISGHKRFSLSDIRRKYHLSKTNAIKVRTVADLYHSYKASISDLLHMIQHLESENKSLKKKLKQKNHTDGKLNRLLRHIENHISNIKVNDVHKKSKQRSKIESEQEIVLMFSDWHIGEVVELSSPIDNSYINRYNIEVAKQRIHSILDQVEMLVDLHRQHSSIEVCHVAILGDMVSGYGLHDDLDLSNEVHIADQVIETSNILTECLLRLGKLFKQVNVYCVVGNHGRTQKQKHYKNITSSYDYLAYKITEKVISTLKISNISFTIPNGSYAFTTVKDFGILMTHGDDIKSWAGIPYYGMMRDYANKQELALSTLNRPVNYLLLGHFHQPITINKPLGSIIVNGSLKGPDEFSIANNMLSKPSQTMFAINDQGKSFLYEIKPQ